MAGDNLLENLEYNEAKQMINIEIVDENHRILENTTRIVEDSVLICENPEIQLNQMRTEVFFLKPDFFNNPTSKNQNFLKKNIELNIQGFEKLCKDLNKFIKEISLSLNNLNKPSQELKKEIEAVLKKFEDTIRGLCAPLVSKTEGLNKIDINSLTEEQKEELELDKKTIQDEINKFLDESEKLNKNYFKLFSNMMNSIEIICDTINEIPNPIQDLQNDIEEGISKFEEILEMITDENKNLSFDNQLKEIVNFFKIIKKRTDDIKKNAQNKCGILDKQYEKRYEAFNKLKNSVKENIAKLTYESEKISHDIINIRDKFNQKKIELPKMKISEIIIDQVYKAVDNAIIQEKNEFSIFSLIPEPEPEKIQLDLLYIMDTTGSMEGYVNETKIRLIDIMEKIISCCNEMVEINLGFIGYKDIKEIKANNYIDIQFTKDHSEVKDKISKIVVGGGDDTAEDVAFGFEKALEKKWGKNSIKFAILVCDAPCHGLKYHEPDLMDDYVDGFEEREEIESLVGKLCDKNVSLCCIKLKDDTNIMYSIFREIYENKKNDKCQFFEIPLNNPKELSDYIQNISSGLIKEFA